MPAFYDRPTTLPSDPDILALTGDNARSRWNIEGGIGTPVVVSYSFHDELPAYDTLSREFAGFDPAQRDAARAALGVWGSVGGLSFVEVPAAAGGDIRFGLIDMSGQLNSEGRPTSGYAYYPNHTERRLQDWTRFETLHDGLSGDVFLNRELFEDAEIGPGNRGYSLMLHEIGHAIGFKHPFEGSPVIDPARDSGPFTVLSYDRSRRTTEIGTIDRAAVVEVYGETPLAAGWDDALGAMRISGDGLLIGSHLDEVLTGGAGADVFFPGDGDNTVVGGAGHDRILTGAGGTLLVDGGAGRDAVLIEGTHDSARARSERGEVSYVDGALTVRFDDVEEVHFETTYETEVLSLAQLFGSGPNQTGTAGGDRMVGTAGNETISGADGNDTLSGGWGWDRLEGGIGDDSLIGGDGGDTLLGGEGSDALTGGYGDDVLQGGAGDDLIEGGDGADTLVGAGGDDTLTGGATPDDRRDVIYGGAGNDVIDGGHGNDELNGGAGADTMEGGYGADTVIGNEGDDVMTGSAFSDLLFGNDGMDFVNGGFGNDRVNGGAGADRFFHAGVAGHGSDWIQDFSDAEGDTLVWGGGAARRTQFQVNFATSPAGDDDVQEAFVIYRPTGQILWALVDGAGEDSLMLQVGGTSFDLLA